ncbi:unnamed protein product [Cuscuta campestris]|uniref:Receptor-like serine/threonine-protein kinase n=1 Tax=Cuscuta campestris TaxID=132261 RepID=A0A484LNZ4_9ASTE|nr:unnamed protein product [Cuscuta campestris]
MIVAFLLEIAATQERFTNISLGSSLTPTTNSSWLSPSGTFAFGFYKQDGGYAVGTFISGSGIRERTAAVWTAKRDSSPIFPSNSTLLLKKEGRLVVDAGQGTEVDVVDRGLAIGSASISDNGNFVLYGSDRGVIWQSFDNPTNTLLPGQVLANGRQLVSSISDSDDSEGIFRIVMQGDGHLVQYPVGTSGTAENSYWASGTAGTGDKITLNLERDGHLYLINSTINIIKNLTRGGYPEEKTINLAKIDADGIFRLYSYPLGPGNRSVLWSTTEDKCAPKGLCGANAFCTAMDNQAECNCVPGFVPVSPGNWSSGCQRNFASRSCQETGGNGYEMRALENTVWQTNSYATFKASTREDCGNACLEDCNCEAAQFKDGDCRKERLPLLYGRRLMTDSNAALIKVGGIPAIAGGDESDGKAPSPVDHKKHIRVDILIVSISLVSFSLLILAISGLLILRSRVWRYKDIVAENNRDGCHSFEDEIGPRAFSYAKLQKATNDFGEELGRGAFGTVFKGVLEESMKPVAVKRLEKLLAEGEKEFENEMRAIGKTHHRNLVKLLGFCIDGTKRFLVYEYLSNGSLADALFSGERRRHSWEERVGIARDIARGLLYLHEECETQIIHCDIKSQNILMDERGVAKISDFGLAKLMRPDQTKTFTGARGTRGYVAPEWHKKGAVTVKADVYSFGIVLLELIARRRSLDWSLGQDEAVLEEWVYSCFESGEVGKLVGDDEDVELGQVERMVRIAMWCIQDSPSLRPSMKKVLLMLEGTVDIPIPPSRSSFLSAI